jgi:hypothetical protein
MAPRHALAALLSLATAASAQSSIFGSASTSMFWTYTSRYADFPSPTTVTRGSTITTRTYTDLRTVKPHVTPTAVPRSTSTYAQYYNDLQLVYQYFPIGAVAESDLVPEYDYSASRTSIETTSYISFSMPVVMTAPASCPTQFTVTTTASVSVPSMVYDQVTPSSTVGGSVSTRVGGDVYTYATWYLSAGAAPFTTTSDYYYRYYIASCSKPPISRATPTSGLRSGGDDDDDSRYCSPYSYYCGTPLKTWIIIIASVIPALFLLGFLESWFWFRRLMRGKSAMRFGTVCWVLISLWVLCFTRMQDARSKDDQKVLQENWKKMGSGAAFKAWMKWGFRHRYPVEYLGQFSKQTVGVIPEGQPVHPAMAQAPPGFVPGFAPGGPPPPGAPGQVFYYGPPPGWVPTPDGLGFMPPPGYVQPTPQQAGYYGGDASKNGTSISHSPVSTVGQPQTAFSPPQQYAPVSPINTSLPPHAAQAAYLGPHASNIPAPSPPPQGPISTPPHPQANAPPTHVNEAPAGPVHLPQAPPNRSNPTDRSLYE